MKSKLRLLPSQLLLSVGFDMTNGIQSSKGGCAHTPSIGAICGLEGEGVKSDAISCWTTLLDSCH